MEKTMEKSPIVTTEVDRELDHAVEIDAVVTFLDWLRVVHPGLHVGAAVIHQNAYQLARECFTGDRP